jgi:uncharacterized protein (TIGR03437 family)
VTFDSVAANILGGDEASLTVQLPPSLRSPANVQLQVTVDGAHSVPRMVPVAALAPTIFGANGVRNEDWTANSPSNPAAVGGAMQIFSTGLIGAASMPVFARLAGRDLTPTWSGPAPGLVGIDEVVIAIPSDLLAMTTQLSVCGYSAADTSEPVCSEPANVTLK